MSATSEASTPEDPPWDDLHDNAKNLLLALFNQEDCRASTSTLKEPTDLSASNISGRHALTLIEKGWAEKVGSEDVGARNAANVYELTSQGKRIANRLSKERTIPMSDLDQSRRVRQLQDQVAELEAQIEMMSNGTGGSADEEIVDRVEQNAARIDDVESTIEDHDDEIEDHGSALDRIFNILEKITG